MAKVAQIPNDPLYIGCWYRLIGTGHNLYGQETLGVVIRVRKISETLADNGEGGLMRCRVEVDMVESPKRFVSRQSIWMVVNLWVPFSAKKVRQYLDG